MQRKTNIRFLISLEPFFFGVESLDLEEMDSYNLMELVGCQIDFKENELIPPSFVAEALQPQAIGSSFLLYNLWQLTGLAFICFDWKLACMFSKGNFVPGDVDA